jgi:hypothetical protein
MAAALFCTFNGLLQGHHLLNVHRVSQASHFFIPGKYALCHMPILFPSSDIDSSPALA